MAKLCQLQLIMVAIFLFDCIAVFFAYFANVSGLLLEKSSLYSTPVYAAFSKPEIIFAGIIVNITLSAATVVDLFLDRPQTRSSKNTEEEETLDIGGANKVQNFWCERFFLFVLNIISCSIILTLRREENISYIYVCVHSMQFVGSCGTALLLCHKLEQKFFSATNILLAHVCFSSACLTNILGFGHVDWYCPNIISFASIAALLFILIGKIQLPWLLSLRARNLAGIEMTVNEMCCLWYSLSTVVIIVLVFGVLDSMKLLFWSAFTQIEVCIFVYSFALYSTVISVVPSRLAKAAVEAEQSRVTKIRRDLIRHFSHEVRSPLNIISSGLTFMESDIAALSPGPQKEQLKENLISVRQACDEVVDGMNEMLQMETMKSGTFAFEQKMVPCDEIVNIVKHCGIVAMEKGVHFSISESVSTAVEETQDVATSDKRDLVLFVDKYRLRQVMRNLITNSVKFTPSGQFVTVNIRPVSASDYSFEFPQPTLPPEHSDYQFVTHAVIEIIDTGAGIAPENHSKVFGAFTQFNANELQAYFSTIIMFLFFCKLIS